MRELCSWNVRLRNALTDLQYDWIARFRAKLHNSRRGICPGLLSVCECAASRGWVGHAGTRAHARISNDTARASQLINLLIKGKQ